MQAEIVEEFAAPPDADGLRGLARSVAGSHEPVRGVIESMTGARFVHDQLEQLGWEVLIADAQKVPYIDVRFTLDVACSDLGVFPRRSGIAT